MAIFRLYVGDVQQLTTARSIFQLLIRTLAPLKVYTQGVRTIGLRMSPTCMMNASPPRVATIIAAAARHAVREISSVSGSRHSHCRKKHTEQHGQTKKIRRKERQSEETTKQETVHAHIQHVSVDTAALRRAHLWIDTSCSQETKMTISSAHGSKARVVHHHFAGY